MDNLLNFNLQLSEHQLSFLDCIFQDEYNRQCNLEDEIDEKLNKSEHNELELKEIKYNKEFLFWLTQKIETTINNSL